MMKYAFVAALLLVGAFGGVLALNVGLRWSNDMFYTQRVTPGEMAFSMPPGSVERSGGELYYPKEAREAAATRKNPVSATPESLRRGAELFAIHCTPCHGSDGKGDGLVAAKFVPPPDLTSRDLHQARTDGYWQSYLSVGGAVMPAYGEALSPGERWDVVNYLRTLAQK
jgi:mono/diheme cytochrome c family protein